MNIRSAGNINQIIADEVHADIDTRLGGAQGGIQDFETTGATTSGDFTGSLNTWRLFQGGVSNPQMLIAGDMNAAVTIDQSVEIPVEIGGSADGAFSVGGDLEHLFSIGLDLLQSLTVGGELSGIVLIGRDLDAAGSISMDDLLSGQVIINEQNLTPPGMWGGVVNLPSTLPGGPITLGPNEPTPFNSPLYGVPSAEVGGGSIGLAPFDINIADTEGANSCNDPESVVIHHYGPVYAVGSNPPVKVFALDGGVEVEVTTDFAVSVDDDPFTLDRTVTVTLPPNTTFQDDYPGLRIEPVRAPESGYSVLRCAWVQGAPPVADWSFSQMHDCSCPADLNGDGVVDADDFFLYLSLFADGDPLADINGDGVIDADDFFAYLTLFAAGC